jgi:hypothetical protein
MRELFTYLGMNVIRYTRVSKSLNAHPIIKNYTASYLQDALFYRLWIDYC